MESSDHFAPTASEDFCNFDCPNALQSPMREAERETLFFGDENQNLCNFGDKICSCDAGLKDRVNFENFSRQGMPTYNPFPYKFPYYHMDNLYQNIYDFGPFFNTDCMFPLTSGKVTHCGGDFQFGYGTTSEKKRKLNLDEIKQGDIVPKPSKSQLQNSVSRKRPKTKKSFSQELVSHKLDISEEVKIDLDKGTYVDITAHLGKPQIEVAEMLGISASVMSKRWKRSAGSRRKWPFRSIRRVDANIACIMANYRKKYNIDENFKNTDLEMSLPRDIHEALKLLEAERKSYTEPALIRID